MTPLLLSLLAIAAVAAAGFFLRLDRRAISRSRSIKEISAYVESDFIWWRCALLAAGTSSMFYVWSAIVLLLTISTHTAYQGLGLFTAPLLGLAIGEIWRRHSRRRTVCEES